MTGDGAEARGAEMVELILESEAMDADQAAVAEVLESVGIPAEV